MHENLWWYLDYLQKRRRDNDNELGRWASQARIIDATQKMEKFEEDYTNVQKSVRGKDASRKRLEELTPLIQSLTFDRVPGMQPHELVKKKPEQHQVLAIHWHCEQEQAELLYTETIKGTDPNKEKGKSHVLPLRLEWRNIEFFHGRPYGSALQTIEDKKKEWKNSAERWNIQNLPKQALSQIHSILAFGIEHMSGPTEKKDETPNLNRPAISRHLMCNEVALIARSHNPQTQYPKVSIHRVVEQDSRTDDEFYEWLFDTETKTMISVGSDADALTAIDGGSLVICLQPQIPIHQILAQLIPADCRPPVIITETIDMEDTDFRWGDGIPNPNSPNVQDMIRNHYTTTPFKYNPAQTTGATKVLTHNTLSIYVRKDLSSNTQPPAS